MAAVANNKPAPLPHFNLAVVGHLSNGKSTLASALVIAGGGIDERTRERLLAMYHGYGHGGSLGTGVTPWVMDRLKMERERGMTVRGNIAEFHSKTYDFTIFDTPGHPQFLRKSLSLMAQCDGAVLVHDATTSLGKESATGRSFLQHAVNLYLFHVREIVVALTFMDRIGLGEHQQAASPGAFLTSETSFALYTSLAEEIKTILKRIGFDCDKIHIVPVCARFNVNVATSTDLTTKKETLSWYKGPSLMSAIEGLPAPVRSLKGPATMIYSTVYKIGGVGTVVVAGVVSGAVEVGQWLLFVPGMLCVQAHSLEVHRRAVFSAVAGQQVGINIKGLSTATFKAGYRGVILSCAARPPFATPPDQFSRLNLAHYDYPVTAVDVYPSLPTFSRDFVVDVRLARATVGKAEVPLGPGCNVLVLHRMNSCIAKVSVVLERLNEHFEVIEHLPQTVKRKDVVRLVLRGYEPMCVSAELSLAHIVLCDAIGVVGGGRVVRAHDLRPHLHIGGDSGATALISLFEGFHKYFRVEVAAVRGRPMPGMHLYFVTSSEPLPHDKWARLHHFVQEGGTIIDVGGAYYLGSGGSIVSGTEGRKPAYFIPRPPNPTRNEIYTFERWQNDQMDGTAGGGGGGASGSGSTTDQEVEFPCLPDTVWTEVFAFLRPRDMCALARTCKGMDLLASDGPYWRRQVHWHHAHVGARFNIYNDYMDRETTVALLRKCHWKWQYAMFVRVCVTPGAGLIDGPFGRVSTYYVHPTGYLVSAAKPTVPSFRELAKKLARTGGNALLLHEPRSSTQRGQVLVALSFAHPRGPKSNRALLLNTAFEAARLGTGWIL